MRGDGGRRLKDHRSLNGQEIKFYSVRDRIYGPRTFLVTINSTPAAGAVAQWTQAEGGSAIGHVGYVERVIDSNTIVVSDMNGQQSTRCTIAENIEVRRGDRWSDTSRQWPGRFIHFEEVGS